MMIGHHGTSALSPLVNFAHFRKVNDADRTPNLVERSLFPANVAPLESGTRRALV
jgi:hypothetical protein